jgi:indolepyruvate ferredoxin oxidoreductase
MVTDTTQTFPQLTAATSRIEAVTRASDNLFLDAEDLAQRALGGSLSSNMLLVGAAFQHGCLPVSAAAIERAIELNGTAVALNVAAFRWGRAWVVDRAAVDTALANASPPPPAPDLRVEPIMAGIRIDGDLRRLVATRVAELIAYQGPAYAREYANEVARVDTIARDRAGEGAIGVVEAYARGLFKLMAYKDEYEVARLHLDTAERARREEAFGPDADVRILLHPPVLRALGLKRKLRLGGWSLPVLRALYAMRGLRGTRLDPFGAARIRRVERELIGEYRRLVARALQTLDATSAAMVAEVAGLPDVVRGYEGLKLGNIERFRALAGELLERLETERRVTAPVSPWAERSPGSIPTPGQAPL